MAKQVRGIPDAPLPILDLCQQEYASAWQTTAHELTEAGHYAWMARFVDGYERVVEIGTGTGQSTTMLAQNGNAVISLDENPACLKSAEAFLRHQGIPTSVSGRQTTRVAITDAPDGIAEPRGVLYGPMGSTRDPNAGTAQLVEGDILVDPEFSVWLRSLPKRDAVVCWLPGIHKAVHFQSQLGFKATDPIAYKIRVQRAVYQLANTILRPGAVLHFVDRAALDNEEVRHAFREAHRQLSNGSSFSLESIDFRLYPLGNMDGEVQIQTYDGTMATNTSIFLSSVLMRKGG
jgi:SAM-dependent methyltransferase